MKTKLEDKIRRAHQNLAPDTLSSILNDCELEKGKVIQMTEVKKSKNILKGISLVAAALVIALVGTFSFKTISSNKLASAIFLDVNPSIEIDINKNEKVIEVEALNEDAKKVLQGMDLKKVDLNVALNAIIGSLYTNGYIKDTSNSILVSVEGKNTIDSAALQNKLMTEIDTILQSKQIDGALLSLEVENDEEIEKLAAKYSISEGKAALIKKITTQSSFYKFEDLVNLTINELNLISESGSLKLNDIKSKGTADDSEYIGKEKAKDIALNHVGLKISEVTNFKVELEWENGHLVYEVDFDAKGYEYEFDINAKNGKIEKFENEYDDDYNKERDNKEKIEKDPSATQDPTKYIGFEAAKEAAFKHAGVSKDKVTELEIDLEHENGIKVYEISFDANGYEYDYEINAMTGAVVKYDREKDDDVSKSSDSSNITKDAAVSIALKHVSLNKSDVRDLEAELDTEKGVRVYEVSFDSGNIEYEFVINAKTGEILEFDREID